MQLEPVQRMSKDIAAAAATISADEARFLVDHYYIMQEDRKRSSNQDRALTASEEPHAVIAYLKSQSGVLENQIKRALDKYTAANPLGIWAREIVGIGPVIAAGLLAHIDLDKAPTVGHIWRFAGLDPTSKWLEGQKRPWNAALKTLCWKVGESFVKVKNNENDIYGKVYAARRALEGENNLALKFADQAAAVIKRVPKHAQRATYEAGMLPDGHLHARAKRYAVKAFLADYHAAGFRLQGKVPPLPYPVAHLGHVHVRHPHGFGLETPK